MIASALDAGHNINVLYCFSVHDEKKSIMFFYLLHQIKLLCAHFLNMILYVSWLVFLALSNSQKIFLVNHNSFSFCSSSRKYFKRNLYERIFVESLLFFSSLFTIDIHLIHCLCQQCPRMKTRNYESLPHNHSTYIHVEISQILPTSCDT